MSRHSGKIRYDTKNIGGTAMEDRIEIRCIRCGKLLGKVPVGTNAEIEIKCPKCKEIHDYRIGKENENEYI